jgi:hypothetical protein
MSPVKLIGGTVKGISIPPISVNFADIYLGLCIRIRSKLKLEFYKIFELLGITNNKTCILERI